MRLTLLTLLVATGALLFVFAASAEAAFVRYTANLTEGDGHTTDVAINQAGDYAAYITDSRNQLGLQVGGPQVYVVKLSNGQRRLASRAPDGSPAANPSATSSTFNPFALIRGARNQQPVEVDPRKMLISSVDMSATGSSVVFSSTATNLVRGDNNGVSDVFINGRKGNRTELVSKAWNGKAANGPSWGAAYGFNKRWVAFISSATNLVRGFKSGRHAQAYLRDLRRNKTYAVSINSKCKAGNGPVLDVAVSEGRYVAFTSKASNLVRRDTNRVSDVFVHQVPTPRKRCGTTTRQSVSTRGKQANGPSQNVSMGVNGKYLAFESTASNLVKGDTNGVQDIFWRIRKDKAAWKKPAIKGPATLRVSVAHLSGQQADGPSSNPKITSAGRFIYFDTEATNIYKEDTDPEPDVYHHDLKTRWTTLSSRRDGRTCQSGRAFECSEGSALGGIKSAISYHGTDIVFLSMGKAMRDGAQHTGSPGVVDVLMRYLGPMSAPVPREYR